MKTILLVLLVAAAAFADTLPADSARGEKLFSSQHCVECHSLNGKGGHIAPDLGRRVDRDFTPMTLASTMWNHAPTMWSAMQARNLVPASVDDQGAADLFAFFYSARFFEKPGDAGRGKKLFAERSCAECHGIAEVKNPAAKPVRQWQSLGDPFALTAAMWNHSAQMGAELHRKGFQLAGLTGQDLTDLLVYLRNLSATKDFAGSFQITQGLGGAELFTAKGCARCHTAAALKLKGQTLTDVAAGMWEHGLRRRESAVHLEPGEMRELLSYAWATPFFQSSGDAARGKRVFAVKRCGTCHDHAVQGAPPLAHGAREVSGITMVSALWRHGPTMLLLMNERKMPWPRFDARDMADVTAYLNTRGSR